LRLTLHRPTLAELSGRWLIGVNRPGRGASGSGPGAVRWTFGRHPWRWNARVPAAVVRTAWPIPAAMQRALDRGGHRSGIGSGLDLAPQGGLDNCRSGPTRLFLDPMSCRRR
jgi:hypothetical protein